VKPSDLKRGMKVKFLISPFDKKYTHGVITASGYTWRKAWVKDKKGTMWFVHAADLFKPRQKMRLVNSKLRVFIGLEDWRTK
jgi:hypothetical protein